MAKWYDVYCPACGWDTKDKGGAVDEKAAKMFEKLRWCQECKKHGVESEFKFREHIIVTRK
jgi:hypothetical protein